LVALAGAFVLAEESVEIQLAFLHIVSYSIISEVELTAIESNNYNQPELNRV